MKTGLLITNYNTWAMTSQAIENCLKHIDAPVEQFIVVDDGSTEPFENQFGDKITLIKNSENQGLIRTLNKGLGLLNTELIVVFDSDAWPLEDFVVKVNQYFENNPEVGIATFLTVNAAGEPSASYEAEPKALSLLLGQGLYQRYQDTFFANPKNITVYSCAMAVRKKVLDEIGNFDENYDWIELDHDLCMRASRAGWKIGIMPLKAFHKGSGTPQKVSHRVIRFYKNRWYLLKKFNKVKLTSPFLSLVCMRLSVEYLLIRALGKVYFKDQEVVDDKAHSRKELIKYFIKSY